MTNKLVKSRWPSFATLAVLSGVLIFLSLNKWKNDPLRVIWSDAEGYYLYLPGALLYQFENMPLRTPGWPTRGNKIFTKYSCGVALMQAPFFAGAHLYASISSFEATGFSYPYGVAVIISAIFYLLAGLLLIYHVLKRHYPRHILLMSFLLLGLGSNLYYYTIGESGMSHIYSFFLFSAIVFLTDRLWTQPPSRWIFILLGISFGLTVLVRPTNLIMGLWIIFYNVKNLDQLRARVDSLRGHFLDLALAASVFLAVWIPQLLYWKYATGEWIAYSYGDEGFDLWRSPKMIQVLTNVENGLFLYSPAVFVAVLGVFYYINAKRSNGLLTLGLLGLATYIFGSWWDWNFGGAFGHRCYVEYYALLFGPLAWIIQEVSKSKYVVSKIAFGVLASVFIYYSLQLTYAYAPPWDGPDWTWVRYWDIVKTFF